jgi:hypothetical protein
MLYIYITKENKTKIKQTHIQLVLIIEWIRQHLWCNTVMVSVLIFSGPVDHGLEPQSGQTKDLV